MDFSSSSLNLVAVVSEVLFSSQKFLFLATVAFHFYLTNIV